MLMSPVWTERKQKAVPVLSSSLTLCFALVARMSTRDEVPSPKARYRCGFTANRTNVAIAMPTSIHTLSALLEGSPLPGVTAVGSSMIVSTGQGRTGFQ